MIITNGLRKVLALAAAALITLVLLVTLIEVLSKLMLDNKFSRPNKTSLGKFISDKPLAFAGAPDYEIVATTQFNKKCSLGRMVAKQNGFPRFVSDNIGCDGHRLINGLRYTTDQPTIYENEIHVFGGSTLWGTGSSDKYTIPSILQRLLNEKFPRRYMVLNHGFSTVVAKQQLAELREMELKSGDIVIFYDGGNDVWQGVVYGRPEGTIIGYNDENRGKVVLNTIKFFLHQNSNFYNLLAVIRNQGATTHGEQCNKTEEAIIQQKAKDSFIVYSRSLAEANDYAYKKGARFYHFLQPTLFSRNSPFSDYELNLISQMPSDMIPCSTYHDAFEKGYSIYKHYYAYEKGFEGHDLTNVLSPTSDGREYFWDWIHVSSVANKRIAQEIFQAIF